MLHLIHIVNGAVMGEVRSRSSPIVLTHAPLDPVGLLTSTPMIPTHPRIPRTAPDPPGEPAEGWKKKKLRVSTGGLLTDSTTEAEKGTSGGKRPPGETRSYLWEKSHDSVTPAEGDGDEDVEGDAHKNTLESLTHSLETIETHVPTTVPFVYLPQASLPTIRPTDGIQYTPRAEVSPVTPGTLSTPANSMVTPLTPWIAGTPKTYWSESSPVTPWPPATPVTQRRPQLSLNIATTATSVTNSFQSSSAVRSKTVSFTVPVRADEKYLDHPTLTTTTHSVPPRGKLSLPNPHVHIKPTSPSTSVVLKDKSKSLRKETPSRLEAPNFRNVSSSLPQDLIYYGRKITGSQDQSPLEDISRDINRQVARMWGGGDNEQLSALEEGLYRDTASWPWLTGRRMRRKLSSERKSVPIVERSSPVQSTKATKTVVMEPRQVEFTRDNFTTNASNLESSKSSGSKLSKSTMLQKMKYGKKYQNTTIPELGYVMLMKSVPENLKTENRHMGKAVKAQVDFKTTKTGDYGGFSVTKTEEIKPADKITSSESKPVAGTSDASPHDKPTFESKFHKHNDSKLSDSDPASKQTPLNSSNVIVTAKQVGEMINSSNASDLPKESTKSDFHSPVTTTPHSKWKEGAVLHVVNKTSNVESRSVTLPTSKSRAKYTHNVSDKKSKEQEEYEPGKRHSSPFIINSKQLREYKANADSHRPHKTHKSGSERRVHATPTKVYPAAYSKSPKNLTSVKGSETQTTTTLSSVFKEDLIPPLPYQWDKGWHAQRPENNQGVPKGSSSINGPPRERDRDTVISSFQSSTKVFKVDDKAQSPISHGKGTKKFEEFISPVGNAKTIGGQLGTKTEMSNYNVEHGTTQATNSLDDDLKDALVTLPGTDNPDLVTHRDSVEVREAVGRGPSWPGLGERVEFVTVVPGGQWDVWGGPSLWDPLSPHNNTYRNPQVYSVYWGDTGGPGSPAGWPEGVWVIRGGSLTAIMALVVTISVQVARDGPAHRGTATADSVHRAQHNQHATLATNLATSLASAHVLLIFGIQATGKAWVCGVVGLLLHFLHLVSCCWLLALTVRLLVALHHRRPIHTAVYCTASWGASLGLVVVSYVVNPEGYETRRYCWMSVERGMLVSFIVPVCTLILVNAGVCVAAQKVLLDMRDGVKHEVMTQHKRDLRGAVSLLPLEGISWFLAVVALEDHQSLALDCAAALVSACLGWLVLYFHGWTWKCHGLCWLRRQIASSRRVDDLSLPLTARYDHDLAHQPLIPSQVPNPATQPHTTVTLAPPATPSQQPPPQQEEFPLQPIFPLHERREVY